jgi:hypothetical protein
MGAWGFTDSRYVDSLGTGKPLMHSYLENIRLAFTAP